MTINRREGMMREITHDKWKEEATALFGPNPLAWRFVCPSCGHVASIDDWVKTGAKNMAAFSCIGRITNPSQGAFVKGKGPCNYAGGGLIGLNPVKVLFEDGKTTELFEFAKKAQGEE